MTSRVARRCLSGRGRAADHPGGRWPARGRRPCSTARSEKDGRIYVFANGAAVRGLREERWGGGRHRHHAPRLRARTGETVVFDSEDAINYYNYKHDIPGEVFAKPKPEPARLALPLRKDHRPRCSATSTTYARTHHDRAKVGQATSRASGSAAPTSATTRPSPSRMTRAPALGDEQQRPPRPAGASTPFVKDAYFALEVLRQAAGVAWASSLPSPSIRRRPSGGCVTSRRRPPTSTRIDSVARLRPHRSAAPSARAGLSYGAQFGERLRPELGDRHLQDRWPLRALRWAALRAARRGSCSTTASGPNGQDRTTAKGARRLQEERRSASPASTCGRSAKSGTATPDTTIGIWSGFGVWEFKPKKAERLCPLRFRERHERGGADVGLPGADTIAYLPISNASPFKAYITGLELFKGSIRVSPNIEIFDLRQVGRRHRRRPAAHLLLDLVASLQMEDE